MVKVVVPLFIVVVLALVWAAWPVQEDGELAEAGSTARVTLAGSASAGATRGRRPGPQPHESAPSHQRASARTGSESGLGSDQRAMPMTARPASDPTPAQPRMTLVPKNVSAAAFPKFPIEPFRASVRAYLGNLPKEGPLPERILAIDVLPEAMSADLGIEANAVLTELGDFSAGRRQAFDHAAKVGPDFVIGFGITVQDPVSQNQRRLYFTLR